MMLLSPLLLLLHRHVLAPATSDSQEGCTGSIVEGSLRVPHFSFHRVAYARLVTVHSASSSIGHFTAKGRGGMNGGNSDRKSGSQIRAGWVFWFRLTCIMIRVLIHGLRTLSRQPTIISAASFVSVQKCRMRMGFVSGAAVRKQYTRRSSSCEKNTADVSGRPA